MTAILKRKIFTLVLVVIFALDICMMNNTHAELSPWYENYHFIAHAGGGLDGRTYTNSLEAWEHSYDHGIRVFDADLIQTSDGQLVLMHDWNDNIEQNRELPIRNSNIYYDIYGMHYKIESNVPTYDEYMSMAIYGKYTPMDAESMCRFMTKHPDIYVSIDVKNKDALHKFYNLIQSNKHEKLLDRIIVNIYTYEDYYNITKIFNWKNVTIRQHSWCIKDWNELARFCVEHDIHVVNITADLAEDDGIAILKENNLKIYYCVVDFISDMNYLKEECYADGFVTNWLNEPDWDVYK